MAKSASYALFAILAIPLILAVLVVMAAAFPFSLVPENGRNE